MRAQTNVLPFHIIIIHQQDNTSNFCEYVESSSEGLTAPALLRYITAFPQLVVLILLRKLLYMSLQSWTPGFCTDSGRNASDISSGNWDGKWKSTSSISLQMQTYSDQTKNNLFFSFCFKSWTIKKIQNFKAFRVQWLKTNGMTALHWLPAVLCSLVWTFFTHSSKKKRKSSPKKIASV